MGSASIACARCAAANHPSNRFCEVCGLPLGAAQADASAVFDVLRSYDHPEPDEPEVGESLGHFIERAGFEVMPHGSGWCLLVPLPLDRKQAVYVGAVGKDPEGRSLVSLVSVCSPANSRDASNLLKLNSRRVEGHFAIRVLRGEEYFVVIELMPASSLAMTDTAALVRRIASAADGLEDRLSRGLDVF